MEELIEQILLRLPPEEPAYLVRAALVCKAWRNMLSDSSRGGFLRRYREFHGTPPMLGYLLHNNRRPHFVATTSTASPPLSMPEASDLDISWGLVLDCRHGRVLIIDDFYSGPNTKLVVWDPITRYMKHLVVPGHQPYSCIGAVLCAIDRCDHLDCRGGPFRVVLVKMEIFHEEVPNDDDLVDAWATVYSSETDAWSAASSSILARCPIDAVPSLLIGDELYFTSFGRGTPDMLKYDLGSHGLSMIDTQGVPCGAVAMKAHDGGLGFVAMWGNRLYLMSRQATGGWGTAQDYRAQDDIAPRKPASTVWLR
ncbi:hypothetical protein BS78_02G019200 [Paspalum vaginatum]|nr:hypothetical protein BS78_02G019200 [Paspalum vaginatum]